MFWRLTRNSVEGLGCRHHSHVGPPASNRNDTNRGHGPQLNSIKVSSRDALRRQTAVEILATGVVLLESGWFVGSTPQHAEPVGHGTLPFDRRPLVPVEHGRADGLGGDQVQLSGDPTGSVVLRFSARSALPFWLGPSIEGDRLLKQGRQCQLVDFVGLTEVDGAPHLAFQARIEESRRIRK
jgi:hypothetical protein